jgi:hypothetical protein
MNFKEWLAINEVLTFATPFRGASRPNLGDKVKSGSYTAPLNTQQKINQQTADQERRDWQDISRYIGKDDCDKAQLAFSMLKKSLLDRGEAEKAKGADIGWQNRYDLSFCPVSKAMKQGDCEDAFTKLNSIQDRLKGQGKHKDAEELDKSFWPRWNASPCKVAV